ncbi:MAG: Eco57I restriction-modification methylase domain-containing protein, partial [Thermoflexibacteraceae bacterium]
ASVKEQTLLFKDRVLPTLDNNIFDGNSLINHDFYENSLFLTPRERRKINTFDWQDKEKGFATIIAQGGFDFIIGNPPYVDYRVLSEEQAAYIRSKFVAATVPEKWNLYVPFVELGSKLLKKQGVLGYILPNTFLASNFGVQLRKILLNNTQVQRIVDVSQLKVFGSVATYPVLLFFRNQYQENNYLQIAYPKNIQEFYETDFELINQDKLNNIQNQYIISTSFSNVGIDLISKIQKNTKPLKLFCEKFIWGTSITGFKSYKIDETVYQKLTKKDKVLYHKVIQTADIKKFGIAWQGEYIKTEIYSENVKKEFAKDKIVIARVTKQIQAMYDQEGYFLGKSSLLTGLQAHPLFLLAIINSQVANYFYAIKFENTHMAGGYLRFDIPYLEQLPIPIIDFNNKKHQNLHDDIIKRTENLLLLNQQLQSLKVESDRKNTLQLIRYTERQLNELVFQLYELNTEEIILIQNHLKI